MKINPFHNLNPTLCMNHLIFGREGGPNFSCVKFRMNFFLSDFCKMCEKHDPEILGQGCPKIVKFWVEYDPKLLQQNKQHTPISQSFIKKKVFFLGPE